MICRVKITMHVKDYALFKNMSSAKIKIIELTLMNLNQTKNDGGR
jgi:hypothetical protein